MMFVLGSMIPCRIGEVKRGIFDERGIFWPEQPFVVVREVSKEEWRSSLLSRGGPALWEPPPGSKFYEVSTD